MKNTLYLISLIALLSSCCCKQDSATEKHQKKRNNVVNIHEKIKEIEVANMLIGGVTRAHIMRDYLIIGDYKSQENLIHIFDKNTFDYIASTARRGQGPDEIANMGHIGINEEDHIFYVSDHGKQCIFSYDMDSVLLAPEYAPTVKMRMNESQFPDKYQYVNDTLCIGLIIEPIGNADYKPSVAKWNMNTGKVILMEYEHPDVKKKRISFAASVEHGIYVECYSNYDLMTICTLDGKGELKHNIYGRNWGGQETKKTSYYEAVTFCSDKIFALYSGQDTFSTSTKNGTTINFPTKFLVFDVNGDYIQTIETGYQITNFCFDEANNRIIMCFDDEIQFGYFNLDELIVS